MNSATKPSRAAGLLILLAAVAAFGLLASGCGDYGPTNIYSKTLFGQTQAGDSMNFWTREDSLSLTAGPDQYVVYMKNVGSGGVIGPVFMTVTAVSGPAGLEAYTSAPGAPSPAIATQTVTFGYPGQAIYSGDTLAGNASAPAMAGPYQYSFQAGFASGDSDTTQTFSYTASDGVGNTWTGTFNGLND